MTALNDLIEIVKATPREPKAAAQDALNLPLPPGTVGMAFALIIVLSAMVYGAGIVVQPVELPTGQDPFSPVSFAIISTVLSLTMVVAVWKVGEALGGSGTAAGSLRLTVLLQSVTLIGQVIELVLIAALPAVSGLFGILLVCFVLWINVNFIAALHGFTLLKGLGTLFLASLGAALCFIFLMTLFGFGSVA